MKKASNIILLIGAILSFASIIGLLIGAIILFVLGSPVCTQFIIDGINNGSINSSYGGSVEEVATFVQLTLIITAVVLLIVAVPTVASGILALRARRLEKEGLYIASIVLGVVCGNVIIIVGAILGMLKEGGTL